MLFTMAVYTKLKYRRCYGVLEKSTQNLDVAQSLIIYSATINKLINSSQNLTSNNSLPIQE